MRDDEKKIRYCNTRCKANKLDGKVCGIYIHPRPLDCEYMYIGGNGRVYTLEMPEDIY